MNLKNTLLSVGAAVALGVSTPAAAVYDSALLAAILEQAIAQLLQQQTINSTIEGGLEDVDGSVQEVKTTIEVESEENARAVMNNDREIYNRQVEMDQQASSFCQQDQTAPTQIGKSAAQRTYSGQSQQFNKYNSPAAVSNPAKFAKQINDEVVARVTNTCDPRIIPPVGKKDVNNSMSCTPEQISSAVSVASGRKVAPEPPPGLKNTDTGVTIRSEVDTYNSRMSAIDGALTHSMSEELDTQITAYQKLFATPSIEELNTMSGKGGVQRDQVVLMQIQGQLLLNIYRESVEQKRLLAIIAAQGQEDHRERISKLAQAAARN